MGDGCDFPHIKPWPHGTHLQPPRQCGDLSKYEWLPSYTELLCPSPNFAPAGTSTKPLGITFSYPKEFGKHHQHVVFGLQSFDWIPLAMAVFMLLRLARMAGRLFKTALADLTWLAHLVVESCTSSDGFNPSWFWTSTNLLWLTRELLKNV